MFGDDIELSFAMNGLEAVDVYEAQKGRFDAILMDLMMPKADGFEALASIQPRMEIYGKVPVIALTAGAGEMIERATSNFDLVLQKPFTYNKLVEALTEVGVTLVSDN